MINDMYNCPNCGAVIEAEKCEYCGTVFTVQEAKDNYSKEKELLAAESNLVQSAIDMRVLYEQALKAMNNYCITVNEARNAIGLLHI